MGTNSGQSRAVPHARKARRALSTGDLQAAERWLRQAVAADPRFAPAQRALGQLLLEQGDLEGCRTHLSAAVKAAPEDAVSHVSLGELNTALGRHDLALAAYARALKLDADDPGALCGMGDALVLNGRLQEAERCFERAARLRPQRTRPAVGLAEIWIRQDRAVDACDLLQARVDAGESDGALLTSWGRACFHARRHKQAVAVLGGAFAQATTSGVRAMLGYTLGDNLARLQRFDEAFAAYVGANAAAPSQYNPGVQREYIEALRTTFEAGYPARLPQLKSRPGPRPVLIVGMPRSGTSLVEQILGRHPQVHTSGELETLHDLARASSRACGGQPFPECLGQVDEALLGRMADAYMAAHRDVGAGSTCVTDKLPDNYHMLGFASLLFPDLRVVYCKRDPLDTCVSCFTQNFGSRLGYTTRLDWLGERYRQSRQLMAHWTQVLTAPIFQLSYEELVSKPEPVIRDLLAHCGLPFDAACLRPEDNRRVVATASYAQVKRKMHKGSVGRAQRYRRHLEPLVRALAEPPSTND